MENNNLPPQIPPSNTQEAEDNSQTPVSQPPQELPPEISSLKSFLKRKKIIFSIVFILIVISSTIASLLIYRTFLSGRKEISNTDLKPTPTAEQPTNPQLPAIEQRFKDKNGRTWTVELNPYTGLIFHAGNMNFQEVTSPLSKEESQRVIFNFLKENKEFFGLEDFQIGIDPIYEGISGPNYEDYAYVIEPHQTYRNLFVARVAFDREYPYVAPDDYKNRISLTFTEQSNAYTQKPHLEFYIHYFYYYPEIKAPTEPKISQEEAIQRLYGMERIKKCKFEKDKNTFYECEIAGFNTTEGEWVKGEVSRLVILPWPNKEKTKLEFRLAWQIETAMHSVYVDAITGEVITSRQNFVI